MLDLGLFFAIQRRQIQSQEPCQKIFILSCEQPAERKKCLNFFPKLPSYFWLGVFGRNPFRKRLLRSFLQIYADSDILFTVVPLLKTKTQSSMSVISPMFVLSNCKLVKPDILDKSSVMIDPLGPDRSTAHSLKQLALSA